MAFCVKAQVSIVFRQGVFVEENAFLAFLTYPRASECGFLSSPFFFLFFYR